MRACEVHGALLRIARSPGSSISDGASGAGQLVDCALTLGCTQLRAGSTHYNAAATDWVARPERVAKPALPRRLPQTPSATIAKMTMAMMTSTMEKPR